MGERVHRRDVQGQSLRHAYLIIAHNEFEVLKLLISMLDDERNDIYVHIDKKVKSFPELVVKRSRLFVLDNRIDVRWGHVSQIKAELVLFESAYMNGPYLFYHLLSGTHLPLKSQDYIHSYFDALVGKSVFVDLCSDTNYQETLKQRRINLFLSNYASQNRLLSRVSQYLWKTTIWVQKHIGFTINKNQSYLKASNWVDISHDAVSLIVSRKMVIKKKYRFSFCGDEYFVPSELMNSPLSETMVCKDDILLVEMGRSNSKSFSVSDLDRLRTSRYLFARKFTL